MPVPFIEFEGNKRLLWIAEEWVRYSDKLAEWAMARLANRRDVWSQYTIKNGQVGVVMLPIKERRKAGAEMVTMNKLRRHFAGRAVSHLIGLHSISDHSTCKWFAIDIDLHDENIPNVDEILEANKRATFDWAGRLRSQGFDPLVIDSNGAGGYHIWVLLDDEYPLADTFDFADALRSDWEELGLPRRPEIFPPKREVAPDDLPYTLRLPGRHHKRPHYSRVYNYDLTGDNEWLEGGEAIEVMLATRPGKIPKSTSGPKKKEAPKPKRKKKTGTQKPRVCVDLDGVLATYDKWKGFEHIGPPLPGAREFATTLAKMADIIVFTSRCSQDTSGENEAPTLTPGQLRIHVIEWLEKHEIPYTDVYMGQGKPRVAAFVDDRAVNCDPQKDEDAFKKTLEAVGTIIRRKPRNP
jgi:hypothetical protein